MSAVLLEKVSRHLKSYWKTSKKLSVETKISSLFLFCDMLFCHFAFGSDDAEYLEYKFYEKSCFARGKFLTKRKYGRLLNILSGGKKKEDLLDKRAMLSRLRPYIKRYVALSDEMELDEIVRKVRELGGAILKPIGGLCGIGIEKIGSSDGDIEHLRERAKNEVLIVEEVIKNHPAVAKLNPPSLNTFRVITTRDRQGELKIMQVVLRMGVSDSCVDNLHNGGIAASVDYVLGIIDGPAFDVNLNKYPVHPTSGEVLLGYKLPAVDTLSEYIKSLADKIPDVRHVGWDVAYTEKYGWDLVEANFFWPGLGVLQICDGKGKYEALRSIV